MSDKQTPGQATHAAVADPRDTPLAYRVEVDEPACKTCGAGQLWTVIGPDDVAIGASIR